MRGRKSIIPALPLLLIAAACGKAPAKSAQTQTSADLSFNTQLNSTLSQNGSDSFDNSSGTTTTDSAGGIGLAGDTYTGANGGDVATADSRDRDPVYQFDVAGTGYEGDIEFEIPFSNTLKVQFQPEVPQTTIAYKNQDTGYVALYSKLMVYIKVGTTDKATPLLSNGLDKAQEKSAIMDYSSAAKLQCILSADRKCPSKIKIIVHRPNYDYWARNFKTYCFYPKDAQPYCTGHTHVYPSHPWRGTLMVQTDSTEAL